MNSLFIQHVRTLIELIEQEPELLGSVCGSYLQVILCGQERVPAGSRVIFTPEIMASLRALIEENRDTSRDTQA